MLENLRQRREDEQGFTLIELMVVVLIIAILIAIAIPTFLGAQDRARDRAAQSDLRNALTAAKGVATDFEGLFKRSSTLAIDVSTMEAENGSLDYVDQGAAPADPLLVDNKVFFAISADFKSMFLQRKSTSGDYFGLLSKSNGDTVFCKDTDGTYTAATFAMTVVADTTAGCSTKW